MHRSFFIVPLLLFLFACQETPLSADETIPKINVSDVRYTPSDVQKMRWLAGAWKGGDIRQSFQFHGGNSLEILSLEKDGRVNALPFVWESGRYYYGQYRQWAITWIGEKDVRLDPLKPGLSPMTWTRQSDQRWHLVRHAPGGDEITVMERANEMHP